MFYRLGKREKLNIYVVRGLGIGLAFVKRREDNFKRLSLDYFIRAKIGSLELNA